MNSKLTLLWMYGIGFLRMMYVHLPIYTLFLVDHQISISMIVFAAMFYSVAQFLFEVPTGVLADMFGQRISLMMGFFLEALGLFVVLMWPTPVGLCVSYAFGGVAAAFLSGSEESLVFENATRSGISQVKAYGTYLNSQTIGMVIAASVGGGLFAFLGTVSYVPLIFTTAMALAVCSVLTLSLHEPHRSAQTASAEGSSYFQVVRDGFTIIKNDKLLKTLLIVSLLIHPGEFFLYNIYQVLFKESHVNGFWFGAVISIGMLLNIGVVMWLGRIEKKFTLEQILGIVTLLCGVAYLVFARVTSAVPAVVSVIVILALVEVYRPVVSDYVNERIPSERRVTVLSTISFAQRIASSLLRIALTGAIILFGTRGGVALNGIYLVCGAVLSWWLLKRCGCSHRLHRHPIPLLPEVR